MSGILGFLGYFEVGARLCEVSIPSTLHYLVVLVGTDMAGCNDHSTGGKLALIVLFILLCIFIDFAIPSKYNESITNEGENNYEYYRKDTRRA